eukprot:jgi/Psemu1/33411/gm1.33411_g
MSVVKNVTHPESPCKKKHNSIAYHKARKCIAGKIIRIGKEPGETNIADLLTKLMGEQIVGHSNRSSWKPVANPMIVDYTEKPQGVGHTPLDPQAGEKAIVDRVLGNVSVAVGSSESERIAEREIIMAVDIPDEDVGYTLLEPELIISAGMEETKPNMRGKAIGIIGTPIVAGYLVRYRGIQYTPRAGKEDVCQNREQNPKYGSKDNTMERARSEWREQS